MSLKYVPQPHFGGLLRIPMRGYGAIGLQIA